MTLVRLLQNPDPVLHCVLSTELFQTQWTWHFYMKDLKLSNKSFHSSGHQWQAIKDDITGCFILYEQGGKTTKEEKFSDEG